MGEYEINNDPKKALEKINIMEEKKMTEKTKNLGTLEDPSKGQVFSDKEIEDKVISIAKTILEIKNSLEHQMLMPNSSKEIKDDLNKVTWIYKHLGRVLQNKSLKKKKLGR